MVSLEISKVPVIDIEAHTVTAADVAVPTMDNGYTVRDEKVLYSWLSVSSAVRQPPDTEVVGLNFSSATTPGSFSRPLSNIANIERHRIVLYLFLSKSFSGLFSVTKTFCASLINMVPSGSYRSSANLLKMWRLLENQRHGLGQDGTYPVRDPHRPWSWCTSQP